MIGSVEMRNQRKVRKMNRELAIRILVGDVIGTTEQTHEAVKMAVEALQEQKTGKWYEDEEVGLCRCDQCQAVNLIHTPFCPMCGTRMEREEE